MKLQLPKPRRCTVRIFDKKGFCSELKLDSSKYDNIGWTLESLGKYLRKYILEKDQWYYYVAKDNYAKKVKIKKKNSYREALKDLLFRMRNILTEKQLDAKFKDGKTIREKSVEYRRILDE